MGWRAKYHTLSKRTAAKKGSVGPSSANFTVFLLLIQYCLSIKLCLCSYKAIWSQQNQRAYQRWKGAAHASSSDASLCIPQLPADIIDLADFQLPTSSIFRQAACSADAFEDTNYDDQKLAGFNGYPPYQSCQDITPGTHNMDHLTDALHGHRLHQQWEYEDSWLERYWAASSNLAAFEHEMHAMMMEYLKEWEEVGLALKGLARCDQELDIRLGQHSREWSVRHCFSLYNDLQVLHAGSDKFLVVYVDRWSW
jgi:hypothetical protein